MSNHPPSPGPPTSPAGAAAPPGPVLLASSGETLTVQADGIDISLTPEPAAADIAEWAGALAAGGGHGAAIRMHVTLEHVRGTNDATVLRVFLRQEVQPQADHEAAEALLASAGLYGLRRASAPGAGDGLNCQLDVTAHAALLLRAMRSQAGRLGLAIRPHRPMPEDTTLTIERVSLWAERFE